MNAFRYLGCVSFDEVDDLLVEEYLMLMEAYKYKKLDKEYETHLQAYLNHAVKATKKVGKSQQTLFPTFKDFFDYDKRLKKLNGLEETPPVDKTKIKMLNINTKLSENGGE